LTGRVRNVTATLRNEHDTEAVGIQDGDGPDGNPVGICRGDAWCVRSVGCSPHRLGGAEVQHQQRLRVRIRRAVIAAVVNSR
jgi:hypothetical protein